jgi:hypothetical protein
MNHALPVTRHSANKKRSVHLLDRRWTLLWESPCRVPLRMRHHLFGSPAILYADPWLCVPGLLRVCLYRRLPSPLARGMIFVGRFRYCIGRVGYLESRTRARDDALGAFNLPEATRGFADCVCKFRGLIRIEENVLSAHGRMARRRTGGYIFGVFTAKG